MSTFKPYLLSLLTGIIITVALALIMLNITMDFRILLFASSLFFFGGSFLNSKTKGKLLLKIGLVVFPYSILFFVFVLEQLPGINYFPFLFVIAGILGGYFKDYKKMIIGLSFVFVSLLFSISIWAIPSAIEKNLSKEKSQPLPPITIHQMDGKKITSNDLKGKVLILDFFGNWCAPCIKELKELDKVQKRFSVNENVSFYVINANFGGDTPEKFQSFIDKKNYSFNYAYDYKSTIYHQLKLPKGGSLPALLIIDKNQVIRFLHIGYNPAETNLSESITKRIEQYLEEK